MLLLTYHCRRRSCHAPQPLIQAQSCCCLGHQQIWLAFISHMPCQMQLASSHNAALPQILPLKEICGEFLFELLTARNCLNLLLELTEKYACSRARRMLSQQMAQNFEALLEEGALWRLPCRVWHEILMQDCLAVSCCHIHPRHAWPWRCTSNLCAMPVQVAHEADVLWAVRQYAQLQESDGMKESVMGRVRPSGTLPRRWLASPTHLQHWRKFPMCLLHCLPTSAGTTCECYWHKESCFLGTVHLRPCSSRWKHGSVPPVC